MFQSQQTKSSRVLDTCSVVVGGGADEQETGQRTKEETRQFQCMKHTTLETSQLNWRGVAGCMGWPGLHLIGCQEM